ncbi:DGQHR domain-containing protein [Flavobacterium salilacus subsp. salilacus]|uniref:DGQHR domain-containing protein n=1 Tax=Flavobacterium TaxID=237 RepID=UPI001074A3F1|nr:MULTISPECIES: DGQHR domain-containing protein [Flavobacterium]KAF2518937.1 DGQHR domain-containing protein [Flavobacterium salilacus subsp. salilacus]MBE1614901.1 DGQHR domain-containing protein [Flavobacterium sp. SaA2.13]
MNTIDIKVIKVHQSIGTIYVGKISPDLLLQMSRVDRRKIQDDEQVLGIQRELKAEKVNQIKAYLTTTDATFPNSIIVNTESKYVSDETDDILQLIVNDSTFTLIDGQHRVEGFRDNLKNNFELIIAIFKDLKIDQQANIFSTINSQQTKVDASHNLSLELDSKIYTPIKMMIEIAQMFHFAKDSPWYNNIRLLGSGNKGIISLSAFVNPLINLTFPEKDYYLIKNNLIKEKKEFINFDFDYDAKRYPLWAFYISKEKNVLYKILLNYFSTLKLLLSDDWLNNESVLNKTTGYNAIMKLFKDLIIEGINIGDLSDNFFLSKLKNLKELNGSINSRNYGASGLKASNELYLDMISLVKKQDEKNQKIL